MNEIIINKKAQKQLKKIPGHIRNNFHLWVKNVEMVGIEETRKIKGYNDEPLHGERTGQRSIRLSRSYRAIYIKYRKTITIEVIEVNKHEY
ncbi:MAG: type II toxin-antitoxin system mRNA interferase toxin, RelE/StbE family [Desulfobacula sp.]|nr:type II toxin-antitoxin system mRNA interferase toxin, RelE/StbE family [Desulfobacula sp.]